MTKCKHDWKMDTNVMQVGTVRTCTICEKSQRYINGSYGWRDNKDGLQEELDRHQFIKIKRPN